MRRRRAAGPLSPRRQVPGVGRPGEVDVEADRKDVRVEWAEGALGAKDVWQCARHPGGPDFPEGQEGGEDDHAGTPEEGEGEDSEDEGSGEEGGPGPPENVPFLCLSFVFFFRSLFISGSREEEKGWPYHDRLRRSVDRMAPTVAASAWG